MKIKINKINKTLILFLFSHLIIWTLIPSISNNNLPLDTIEALAWGSNIDWGFSKHPPLSAFMVEIFYQIFGSQDWAYYFLSQLFIVFTFFIIFKFSEDFFKKPIYSLISIFLLEGIFFYNFTTPEFNVNICQLPFWALTVLYTWKGFKNNNTNDWLLLGIFAALGVLSKYIFIYLLISLDIFFIYLLIKKEINFKCLISLFTFLLVMLPHLTWLVENDYTTINYAFHRSGQAETGMLNHFINPLTFAAKQIGILIPFSLMLIILFTKFKFKINFKDKKLIFLLAINILPLIFIFLTSLFLGSKIRTMWMTPFYLFIGVLCVYLFQNYISLKKLNFFLIVFMTFFLLSPLTYFYISISQSDKRTDYPGKEISQMVELKWEENFINKIGLVGGDEWHGGNLSYHLSSRPKWDNILEGKNITNINNAKDGFVLIGDSDILTKICSGIFFIVEKKGICMIGKNK
jgi:4-amino-4-deoxy-L-arabinose transferase-like glycosyltransferase